MKKIAAIAATAFAIIIATIAITPMHKTNAVETIETATADSTATTFAQLAANALEEAQTSLTERLKDFASTFLGRRYVYGSTGPKSFDCSGFTSYVFRNEGIDLPRTSRMQYTVGEKVDRDSLKAGDLMFFSSPLSGKGRVGHVAIVVDVDKNDGSCTFIHASRGKGVNLQKFPDGGYYSRHYIGAKRVISSHTVA